MKTLSYKIIFVPSNIIAGYDGMNYYAAQELGFDYSFDKDQILVNKELSFLFKIQTIIHEITEINYMKQGVHYWRAHKHAYEAENDKNKIKLFETALKGKI